MDTHIYASARGVLEALARHDCGPALAWCEAHRPRLRKQKSKLEFKLRVQARPPRTACAACECIAYCGMHRRALFTLVWLGPTAQAPEHAPWP